MVSKKLLAATALVMVGSLAAPSETLSRPQTLLHGRDSNDEFLRTYLCQNGDFLVSTWYITSGSSTYSWQRVAVPIIGHGQTVNRIIVQDGGNSAAFTVGIYRNTPRGFVGDPIAVGGGIADPSCGRVTISIPAVILKDNKKYWIEERADRNGDVFWAIAPNTKRKAYIRDRGSRWMPQSEGPWFELK